MQSWHRFLRPLRRDRPVRKDKHMHEFQSDQSLCVSECVIAKDIAKPLMHTAYSVPYNKGCTSADETGEVIGVPGFAVNEGSTDVDCSGRTVDGHR